MPFKEDLEKAAEVIEKVKLADEETGEACPLCEKPVLVKIGRFGKFLACSGYPIANIPVLLNQDRAKCPECGADIIEKRNKKNACFTGAAITRSVILLLIQNHYPNPVRNAAAW